MSAQRGRSRPAAIGLLGMLLAASCQRGPAPDAAPVTEPPPAPDRLAPGEALPESETAFGLPLPKGMRIVRHFNDSAYFAGPLDVPSTLEHIRKHVVASAVQMLPKGAVFPRARIAGDDSQRVFRIQVTSTTNGSQVHIDDITQAPAPTGLSEAEILRRAGRNPDGTVIDQNSQY